ARTLLASSQEGDPVLFNKSSILATEAVSTREQYNNTIRALCAAEIVVFDITGFEPAVMLLLGIRAVVRRGITICSVGEKFTLGETFDFPFNIQEVNIVAHSAEQYNLAQKDDEAALIAGIPLVNDKYPGRLLGKRIRDSLVQST